MANSLVDVRISWSALTAISLLFLTPVKKIDAAEFSCSSGNVTCLISAIETANLLPGAHTIMLDPGIYTLPASLRSPTDPSVADAVNGLPSIKGSIRIQAISDTDLTIIERDPNAAESFRILHVSLGGELIVSGVMLRRGRSGVFMGPAIFNRGVTSVEDSVVTEATGEAGAIHNRGVLNILRTTIVANGTGHEGGGIHNSVGASLLVENSTISHNGSADGGALFNRGAAVIKDTSIVSNRADCCQPGGGVLNVGGSVQIINSTIAQNFAGAAFGAGGGGVSNIRGTISITNSSIRENQTGSVTGNSTRGAGIWNSEGFVSLQNTIVAGNAANGFAAQGPDCFGDITSLGNNLLGEPSGCTVNLQASDLTGDPGLGPLVEMGEDDQPGKAFYPVLPGSAVINRANANACTVKDQLGNPRVGTCDIGAIEFQGRTQVSIDIRPRREANKINPHSTRSINVALLSDDQFDATGVDSHFVRFGATGTEGVPVHLAQRDVNGDGRRDLVLRFLIHELAIECGATSATLTGQVSGDQSFIGSAPITTTGCKQAKTKTP
jgi:hypothetical protein